MRGRWFKVVGVLAIAMFALAGCSESGEGSGDQAASCEGDAVSDTGLPADFPVPSAVTFTEARTDGPSQVAEGFATEDLDGMFNEWKEMLEAADYDVLFDEQEEDDAEISYQNADTTGQIALRNDCGDNLAVKVTARPR